MLYIINDKRQDGDRFDDAYSNGEGMFACTN